jgi:hypothetical protein
VAISAFVIALIIERLLYFKRISADEKKLHGRIKVVVEKGRIVAAAATSGPGCNLRLQPGIVFQQGALCGLGEIRVWLLSEELYLELMPRRRKAALFMCFDIAVADPLQSIL